MLRQNIEHFLKKHIYEKLEISEMKQLNKFFFLFLDPRLYILFLVDKSMT